MQKKAPSDSSSTQCPIEDNSYKLWNQVSRGQHQKRDLPRRFTVSTALISRNDPNDKGSRENGGGTNSREEAAELTT